MNRYCKGIRQILFGATLCVVIPTMGCRSLVATRPAIPPAQQSTELIEVKDVVPDVILDIRYATSNNFTGHAVYSSARCFLVKEAAYSLHEVESDLRPLGYRLKVYDGYRPLSVQKIFWQIMPDPRYVADPKVGSRHNRGYAVDISLTDLNGNDVPMPSAFDDFTERANPEYQDIPADAGRNREILRHAMESHGFTRLATEWWHFDYQGWENKPILDIPVDRVGK